MADEPMKDLIQAAVSRSRGTKEAKTVERILAIHRETKASQPGGKRGKVLRRDRLHACETALRQYVYGGTSAAGAATAAGLKL